MPSSRSLSPQQARMVLNLLRDFVSLRDGKTQADQARELGVSQGFLNEVLSGKKKPSGKVLIGLFEAAPQLFGVGGKPAVDTLAAARDAADFLAKSGVAPIDRAWAEMYRVPLNLPDAHGFYLEAKRRIEGDSSTPPDDATGAALALPPGPKRKR